MNRKMAFRVYGRFVWPVNPEPGGDPCEAIGEFEFFLDDGGASPTSCIAWTPRGHSKNYTPSGELADAVNDPEKLACDKPFCFRLSKELPSGRSLDFDGAVVFDQYRLEGEGEGEDEGGLDLRWLLARDVQLGANGRLVKRHSKITVGFADDVGEARFGFSFALPTPGPHGHFKIDKPSSGSIDVASTAVPFRVRYACQNLIDARAAGAAPKLSEFTAGFAGTDTDDQTPVPGNNIVLRGKALGQFGLADSTSRTDADYLKYPRKGDDKRNTLWPRKDEFFANLVGPFAQTTLPTASFGIITESGDTGPLHASIWFEATGSRTRMAFRSAVKFDQHPGSTKAGDIGCVSNRTAEYFALADPTELDRWLRLPGQKPELLIDLILEYEIAAHDIWSLIERQQRGGGALDGAVVELRLGFEQDSWKADSNGDLRAEWKPKEEGTSVKAIVAMGLRGMRLSRLGLDALGPMQPDTVLPHMDITTGGKPRMFALVSRLPATLRKVDVGFASVKGDQIVIASESRARDTWRRADFAITLWPDNEDKRAAANPKAELLKPLTGKIGLPGLRVAGNAITAELCHDGALAAERRHGLVSFRFRAAKPDSRWSVRVSGLEMTAAEIASEDGGPDPEGIEPWLRFRVGRISDKLPSPRKYNVSEVDFVIRFPVSRVEPVGVDFPWGDRSDRERPLLITPENVAGGSDAAFAVTARETLSRSDDRRMTITIDDISDDKPGQPNDYAILGSEPFSIARVSSRGLGERGDEAGAAVASYDSDTRQWTFRQVARRYQYRLPPQSVGESMDKPRRLEIVDATKGNELRPYADPSEGVARSRAVDFRLTPPADLWIEPADVERSFNLPEWASHEIFRQSGVLGLGAGLAGLRGEFVYGLAVSVDPSREIGAARGARVAEVEALLGRPPGRIEGVQQWQQRWNRVSRALARRPERLEVWNPAPGQQQVFAPTRFADGVRFALRETARIQSPFADGLGYGTGHQDVTLDGLPGGALWPLEQRGFLDRLLRERDSTGGTIERIALSPHGGDADLRAEFLNGMVAVIAETRSGRVQRQRLEVIGRIGVFWHRAKHVVVYERTVNPSPQFTPDGGMKDLTRRPVLRKVEEYVELLQPERHYPDSDAATLAAPGVLHAVRFNSRRIHVDSEWSEDVGTTGWRIPLWNRHSAQARPSVYPMPDIGFVSHAEGEGELPLVTQECLDPDNLWFYTDTAAPNSDTDRWLAVLGVDWTNLPAPSAEQQPRLDDGFDKDGRKPGGARIPRGHRRFTWRLGPASRRSAINAGRGGEPIYAKLETLTFSRAMAEGKDSEIEKRFELAGKAMMPPPIGEIQSQLGALKKAIEDKEPLKDILKKLEVELGGIGTKVDAFKLNGNFHEILGNPAKACDQAVADFTGSFQRKKLRYLQQLRSWAADHPLPTPAEVPSWEDLQGHLLEKAMEALSPALQGVQRDVGNARRDLARARAIAADFEDDLRREVAEAHRALDEAAAKIDQDKPWSLARIDTCHAQIAAARDGLGADIEALASDLRGRLATELDQLSHTIGSAAAQAIEEIVRGKDGLLARLHAGEGAADTVLRAIEAQARAASEKLDRALAKVLVAKPDQATLLAVRAQVLAIARAIDIRVGTMRAAIKAGSCDLGAMIADGAGELTALMGEISQSVADSVALLKSDTSGEIDDVKDSLIGALDDAKTAIDGLVKEAARFGEKIDPYIESTKETIEATLDGLDGSINHLFGTIDEAFIALDGKLTKLGDMTKPDAVKDLLSAKFVKPALEAVIPESEFDAAKVELEKDQAAFRARLERAVARFDAMLDDFDREASEKVPDFREAAKEICQGIGEIKTAVDEAIGEAVKAFPAAQDIITDIRNAAGDIDKLRKLAGQLGDQIEDIGGKINNARVQAEGYADRVLDAAGNVTRGGAGAAPGNLLRLYAAAAAAPQLPNFDINRKLLGCYYKELGQHFDTTKAEAWFGRLGDELKALGLALPFDKIGETIIPRDLSNFDISKVFRNFGGIDLSSMFKGLSLPKGAKDAIRVTHAFDKQQARAWVQIDIDLPLPGRNPLFTIGPFTLDFVDVVLRAFVRLEASKDSSKVEQTGDASILTTVDAVVSGQSMVALEAMTIRYTRSGGLDVDIDPSKIKLNPAFKFIQETLGSLFPDQIGGLTVVKQNGIPVGVEHGFALPRMDLMAGTSGVSNISISNRFSLLAYPDFVIADSFALARPDMPFIFSFFIIGGTGYLTIDTQYRPFDSELLVIVEAGAGGSAALGLSAGPVRGSVFITISIALTYRKLIGRSGGGLSVSVVLVIAGTVSIASLVTTEIVIMLRMAYHPGGRIDGVGTLSVTVRVSRFFKISVNRSYERTLRNGGGGGGGAPPERQVKPGRAEERLAARG